MTNASKAQLTQVALRLDLSPTVQNEMS